MDWATALILLLGLVSFLMLTGLPVAFVFIATNVAGAMLFLGGTAGLGQVVRNGMQSVLNYSLAPIPIFILMGELMLRTGLAFRAIGAIDRMIQRVPGRMPIVSVAAGTAFSALSGSAMANTAMLGKSLLPEMLRKGYSAGISIGPIIAVGGIAILIPPSALAVLLGSLARIPVSDLLIAGIVPGFLMALFFVLYIAAYAKIRPASVPDFEPTTVSGWRRWGPFVKDVLPLFLVFFLVVGSLLGGFATPTESASVGVVGTLIAAAIYRELKWASIFTAICETGKVAGMILFIVVGSLTFSQILAFSGAASGLLSAINALGLTELQLILVMVAVLLVLGCFVDQVSMMMITVPFFIPMAQAANIDLIWLGLIYLLALEISLITPPFGLLLFVMKGVAPQEISLGVVMRAAVPFLLIELFLLALIIALPGIGLWLPTALAGN